MCREFCDSHSLSRSCNTTQIGTKLMVLFRVESHEFLLELSSIKKEMISLVNDSIIVLIAKNSDKFCDTTFLCIFYAC